ncbi:AAA family ATPase [Streptomyces sp. NBC_01551]|uniref:nSTAND1 domain-containing NTPase n=1 Tax=Streptomyces sp. NBC_01551 TaxID=2975876 RepID=UPI00225450FD|nr:AAA family ATPase [Streptomyces sp. NBC_01551]MCX4524264.1 AAA family ATPase [Streptomyces sp. NBC_01551]
MQRRPLALVLDVLLMLLGALLGIATNYATSVEGEVPLPLRVLRQWSIPLVGLTLLALAVGQLWLRWLERRPLPAPPTWTAGQPPYPGLEAFGEQDAAVFFGRERETAELVARLHPPVPAQARRFVTVVGPSGSGKSSLVRAGLLPALTARRSRWNAGGAFTPGTDPVGALRQAFAEAGHARPLALVVDQLEELLTLSGPRERTAFAEEVRELLRREPKVWLIGTLRSDFLTGFLEADLAALAREPVVIGPLGRDALHEVVARPAAAAGVGFEPGLVSRIVDDCGGGDALPLLAYTLQELYGRAGGAGSTITHAHYGEVGGVAGALVGQADRIHAALLGPGPRTDADPVVAMLLRMVTVERDEPTRRRVAREELGPAEREMADAFVAGRLLTSDAGMLDVAHEALLRQWRPLRLAVADRLDQLRRRAELERWAQEWEFAGRAEAYLLTGERLQAALAWPAAAGPALSALAAEFARASARSDGDARARTADAVAARVLENVEREPETAIGIAHAAVTEYAPTPAAVQALRSAVDASRLRAVHHDFDRPVTDAAWSPDGSRLAACSGDGRIRVWSQAGLQARPVPDAAPGPAPAPGSGSAAGPVEIRVPGDWPRAVAWSPDGSRLACVTRDAHLTLWSTTTWRPLNTVSQPDMRGGGGGAGLAVVAFSPDGRLLVTGGAGPLRLWHTDSLTLAGTLVGHARMLWNAVWSPDGTLLAASGKDRRVRIWRVADGRVVRVLRHQDTVAALAWSPDGTRLASGSSDRTAVLWDPYTGENLRTLRSMDGINCLAWSPDGTRLAAGDQDRGARIWDLDAPDPEDAAAVWLAGHTDTLYAVAWSPDGTRLATASRDRTVAVWDAGAPRAVLRGHTESVWQTAWSPDGTRLASASQDGTVRLWDPADGTPAGVLPTGQCGDLAWSPDGTRIAVGRRDGTAAVFGPDGTEHAAFHGHGEELSAVCWSPDGTRIATTSRDSTVRIWDAAEARAPRVLSGHADWVTGAAWSPGGAWLATCGTDRTVIVWDTETGRAVATLRGHTDHVWKVAWSPDGTRLATGSRDRTLRVWEFPGTSGTPGTPGAADAVDAVDAAVVLSGHDERIQDLAWSPDGTRLASVSRDRTVRLWDPVHGTAVSVLGVHADWVNGLCWSPDGTRIATASRDRTVRLWTPAGADAEPLLRLAAARILHPPTPEERRAYQLPAPS